MKITNGWHDNNEWPAITGQYYVISVLHVPNPDECPELIVRDGDTIIDIDYFDADNQEWDNYPMENFDNGWEIVAWKEMAYPMIPKEFSKAVLFNDLPVREPYGKEKK